MTATAGAGPEIIIPATGTTTESTTETTTGTTTGTIGAMATKMIVTIVTATNTDHRGTSNRRVGCGQTGVSPAPVILHRVTSGPTATSSLQGDIAGFLVTNCHLGRLAATCRPRGLSDRT